MCGLAGLLLATPRMHGEQLEALVRPMGGALRHRGDRHPGGQPRVARLGDGVGQRAEHQRGDQAGHQHAVQREEIQLALRRRLDPVDERYAGCHA